MDLVNFLFPRKCLTCKKDGKYICDDCFRKVRVGGISNRDNLKVYSLFKYEGVIKRAIISLKYKFATDISEELVDLSVKKLKNFNYFKSKNFTLVPIPLHIKRENWRGFNQTEIVGEKIALEMGWSYSNNLLVRIKNTNPQVELKSFERSKNLLNAFTVDNNNSISKNRKLIIFDDVYTTGSTIIEAAKALKNIGFKKIFYFVLTS